MTDRIPPPVNLSVCAAAAAFLLCGLPTCRSANAQPEGIRSAAPSATESGSDLQKQRFDAFSEQLSGCRFVGSFTVTGRESGGLTAEEYHIKSVQKMEAENMWLFTARIKYGKYDYSVPLPLEVLWAGDTPVITVSDFSILGQGPFSARVVIHDNKYAGTWSHAEVGGHLFGTIVPNAAEGVEVSKPEGNPADSDTKKPADGIR
jgi:hypothetical protein